MKENLQEAKEKMAQAAKIIMTMEPPRNINAAWSSVAMAYSSEFVTQNYDELSKSFNENLK